MLEILVANGFVSVPVSLDDAPCAEASVATVLTNFAALGFLPDDAALKAIRALSEDGLAAWWPDVSLMLEELSGADRDMDSAVVYRNFPAEVVEMTEAGYVLRQLLIYFGLPYDAVRDDAVERAPAAPLGDLSRLKVLALADGSTLPSILAALVAQPSRWSDPQRAWASALRPLEDPVDVSLYAFRENGVRDAADAFGKSPVIVPTATDVLRLAAALSDADVSLRVPPKLRAFSKAERRLLLDLLETAPNLTDDLVTRPGPFKRLLERLHPGTWRKRYPRTVEAYDILYRKAAKPFSARLDPQEPTLAVLDAAAERPGELLRAFHRLHALFGRPATDRLLAVLDGFPTTRLVEFAAYLRTVNDRKLLLSPPRGDWAKLQVRENLKAVIPDADLADLTGRVDAIVGERLRLLNPAGFAVDPKLAKVKLRSNAQKLSAHGAGTRFAFPADSAYVRSASYWQTGGDGNIWFDNGWNFFDADWKPVATVTWDAERFPAGDGETPASVFSGDPAIANVEDRRGCQMIDLYPERLAALGVRYALWGVLAYSNIPFSEANDVLATLSFGADPQAGDLFDPALAQFVFPLKSKTKRSYVAYLDLEARETVFMDLELPASVQSATNNLEGLSKLMPAVVEWIDARPSVADLLAPVAGGVVPALYDDPGEHIHERAGYVFMPLRSQPDSFKRITLDGLLSDPDLARPEAA